MWFDGRGRELDDVVFFGHDEGWVGRGKIPGSKRSRMAFLRERQKGKGKQSKMYELTMISNMHVREEYKSLTWIEGI
jgi:hypothetical protein